MGELEKEPKPDSIQPLKDCPSIACFKGITNWTELEFDGRSFRLCTYAAYQSKGQYAPEMNGIGILDASKGKVLISEHLSAETGKNGCTLEQQQEFERIKAMSWSDFQAFVNAHPKRRYEI